MSPKLDRFPASLEASGLVKLTTPKQSHHFVEVEFEDFSHVVAYSILKLEKVVNLTTLCYTRFTISQMGHALEISQVLLLATNLSSYTLCLASLPRGLLPFHRKLSHFFPRNPSLKISSNGCTRFKISPLLHIRPRVAHASTTD